MLDLKKFRKEKDHFFASHPYSPLPRSLRRNFRGLQNFPENPELQFHLEINEFEKKEEIIMQTSTGDTQRYNRFGKVTFEVDGIPTQLTVFANEHGFFLPFADSDAGVKTYGAGRYLEPELLPDGKLLVDFNLAYNPYCAYSEEYSCPITPAENRLNVPIEAGEMIYEN